MKARLTAPFEVQLWCDDCDFVCDPDQAERMATHTRAEHGRRILPVERTPRRDAGVVHGTNGVYATGCRCRLCTEAHRLAREQKKRTGSEVFDRPPVVEDELTTHVLVGFPVALFDRSLGDDEAIARAFPADSDRCRPHGFFLDPALIPPDDEAQDALCALAAEVEHARLECGLSPVDAPPALAVPGSRPAGARPGVLSAERLR